MLSLTSFSLHHSRHGLCVYLESFSAADRSAHGALAVQMMVDIAVLTSKSPQAIGGFDFSDPGPTRHTW